jgi:hypothetical protein
VIVQPKIFRAFLQPDPRDLFPSSTDEPSPADGRAGEGIAPCERFVVDGDEFTCVPVDSRIRTACFAITFDTVAERLQSLPRLYWEPDGSFIWTGVANRGRPPWQLNGPLTDGGDCLAYLELHGYCRDLELNGILQALGWPEQRILFQLVHAGIFVDEPSFRRAFIPTVGPTKGPL